MDLGVKFGQCIPQRRYAWSDKNKKLPKGTTRRWDAKRNHIFNHASNAILKKLKCSVSLGKRKAGHYESFSVAGRELYRLYEESTTEWPVCEFSMADSEVQRTGT